MARELGDRDREILRKLVPEFDELLSQGIDLEYMNILPPVANHHSKDEKDFGERLKRLSAEDLRYLADLVIDGTESLGCLYPEYADVLFGAIEEKLSPDILGQVKEAYESGSGCG